MTNPKYHIGQVIVAGREQYSIVGAQEKEDKWWYYAVTTSLAETTDTVYNFEETEIKLALVNGTWISNDRSSNFKVRAA